MLPVEDLQSLTSDRRRFPRFTLKVGVHANAMEEGKIRDSLSSQSENLGAGGLSFRARQELPVGQKLLISFFLPAYTAPGEKQEAMSLPIIARSRVVWCSAAEQAYRCGIEFLDINLYSRKLFQAFLETYQSGTEYQTGGN